MPRQISQRQDFHWFKPIEVRWGDMDALGHVNNAQYFVYSETARLAYFDELFGRQGAFADGQGPILGHIGCDFHQQVRYPAELEAAIGIQSIGSKSLVLACPIFRAGEAAAVADVKATLVWFDYQQQKPIEVPQLLRDQLKTS